MRKVCICGLHSECAMPPPLPLPATRRGTFASADEEDALASKVLRGCRTGALVLDHHARTEYVRGQSRCSFLSRGVCSHSYLVGGSSRLFNGWTCRAIHSIHRRW